MPLDDTEIKGLIEAQGKAFEAFKTEVADLAKKGDPLIAEKIGKIETSLDAAVEAKAKMEAGLKAERAEREALELKINRLGLGGKNEDEAKTAVALHDLNQVLASVARERTKSFTPLDRKGFDEYKAAQVNLLRRGKDDLTPDEIKTLSVGSDPDGGYFVTPDLSGRIVTKVFETSAMRQVASVQQISTGALEGIEDLNEAGAGYAGETTTSGNTTTPQVGKWSIPVWWIDTEPKATQQLLDDAAVDVEAWLAAKVADKFARFENAEFVAGAVGKIRGITSYTTAADSGTGVTWGQFGHKLSGVNGDFAASNPADQLHDVVGMLKNGYLMNARWMMRREVITKIRKFKATTGEFLWQPSLVANQPETLLGYPITRAEDMPALSSNGLSLAFGDFAQAYQIVDRLGTRVLRDQLTAKPYIKFYTTRRTGGGAVNFEAVKFLKFAAA